MRRSLTARAATLLLALLLPATSVRAATPTCCVAGDDCDLPCCDKPAQPTVLPVLPCCRVVSLDQAPADSHLTTLESAAPVLVASAPIHPPLLVVATHRTPPPAHPLRAPPLYQQHCALLL